MERIRIPNGLVITRTAEDTNLKKFLTEAIAQAEKEGMPIDAITVGGSDYYEVGPRFGEHAVTRGILTGVWCQESC